MLDHQPNQLAVAELVFRQSKLFINRLTLTQEIARLQVHLAQQLRQLLPAQRRDVIVYFLERNATLPEQLVQLATLRSRWLFVDLNFIRHDLWENPPYARCFSHSSNRQNVGARSELGVVTFSRLMH